MDAIGWPLYNTWSSRDTNPLRLLSCELDFSYFRGAILVEPEVCHE